MLCSGGIEPLFSVVFERNVLGGQRILEVNRQFEAVAKERGFYNPELLQKIHEKGSVQGLAEVPLDVQKVFVTAHDIDPERHVRMQAAFQQQCDASISKTCNLRHDATVEDVRRVFISAYQLGCKGVTVYRDGCRKNQPMALASSGEKPNSNANASEPVRPLVLPDMMPAVRIKQVTPFGNMHIKVVVDAESGLEREIFAQLGRGGDLANSDLEAICRLMSLYLRVNGSLDDLLAQLKGIGSSISIPTREGRIWSLADGLARGLQKYQQARAGNGIQVLRLGQRANQPNGAVQPTNMNTKSHRQKPMLFRLKCSCGGEFVFQEGCMKCPSCGYSEC